MLEELDDATLGRPAGPLPAPRSFAMVVLQRLAAAPAGTEALVTAAAVLGQACELATAAAVAGLADPAGPLDAAVRAGFLEHRRDRLARDEVQFSHALVRAAVLDALAPSRRTWLHTRAAVELDGPAALEHRAAAALLPDAGLAGELGHHGHQELAAGAVDLGVHHLLEAARLAPGADAARRQHPDLFVRCRAVALQDPGLGVKRRVLSLLQHAHVDGVLPPGPAPHEVAEARRRYGHHKGEGGQQPGRPASGGLP